ncbi:unnamed protein product [Aphis gossypii]|uniref:Uncharacterized protein n=1 Tax=Aphis gossypii TaxID=80765 RepID=A0A9P0JBU1_APHGO|nr:unnamed protein product [Aphis gossypii]
MPQCRSNDIKCKLEIPKMSKTENNIINCDGKNSGKIPRFELIQVIKPSVHFYARARRNMLMDVALVRRELMCLRIHVKMIRKCIIILCYIRAIRKIYLKKKQPFFLNKNHHILYLMKNLSPRFKNKFPLIKEDLNPINPLSYMKK